MSMKRTSLFLDEQLLKNLKRAADRKGVSVASLVREAVSHYLQAPEEAGFLPSIAGRFSSGAHDTASKPDEYLWRDPNE